MWEFQGGWGTGGGIIVKNGAESDAAASASSDVARDTEDATDAVMYCPAS